MPDSRMGLAEDGAIPLFSYGFRPFFLGAAFWTVVALILLMGSLAGFWELTPGNGALSWHGHEMLFGYGSGVVAGFLLTTVPNWTGRLSVAGWRLALLFALRCSGRLALLAIGIIGVLPAVLVDNARGQLCLCDGVAAPHDPSFRGALRFTEYDYSKSRSSNSSS